jgi:hypothetical protein
VWPGAEIHGDGRYAIRISFPGAGILVFLASSIEAARQGLREIPEHRQRATIVPLYQHRGR